MTGPWLRAVYGALPGYVAVVALPGGSARFFRTSELDRAAAHLASIAQSANAYVSCCTLGKPPTKGRGRAVDMLAAPGLWADLDLAGPGHKRGANAGKLMLPRTVDEALAVAGDLGLPPSAIVHSGHGVHLWWLLSEPSVFTTAEDRTCFAGLSRRFGATLVEFGRRRGFHVDNVSDLARILRPPGTMNRKGRPVPVTLTHYDPECRYTVADLAAALIVPQPAVEPPPRPQRPVTAGADRVTPAEAFARYVPWPTILEPAGFTLMYQRGETGYWRHHAATSPAGTPSATTDAHGVPVLVVHSESAGASLGLPVGPGQRLTKFRTWALLHYRGDGRAAARALRRMGRRTP